MRHLEVSFLTALYCLSTAGPVSASEQLMEKSGCISCHRIDTKLIGPAFKDIAARYKNKPEIIDSLLQKVREGGEGAFHSSQDEHCFGASGRSPGVCAETRLVDSSTSRIETRLIAGYRAVGWMG